MITWVWTSSVETAVAGDSACQTSGVARADIVLLVTISRTQSTHLQRRQVGLAVRRCLPRLPGYMLDLADGT